MTVKKLGSSIMKFYKINVQPVLGFGKMTVMMNGLNVPTICVVYGVMLIA